MAEEAKEAAETKPDLCPECEGMQTVPAQKTDEKGNPTAARFEDRAHGSQWCPTCKGTGFAPVKSVTEEAIS